MSVSFFVSVHFSRFLFSFLTASFLGGTGLAGTRMSAFWILLQLRVMEMVVTTKAIRCAELQSDCPSSKPTPGFFTGRMPSYHPANGVKALFFVLMLKYWLIMTRLH